jgi:hypothetical protein
MTSCSCAGESFKTKQRYIGDYVWSGDNCEFRAFEEYRCVNCSRQVAKVEVNPQTNRKAAEDVWNLHMTRSLDMDW